MCQPRPGRGQALTGCSRPHPVQGFSRRVTHARQSAHSPAAAGPPQLWQRSGNRPRQHAIEELCAKRQLTDSGLRSNTRVSISLPFAPGASPQCPRQPAETGLRTDWSLDEVTAVFEMPFNDLLYEAQRVHRHHFDPNSVQISTLLSIKTGACPEDCAYCPQSIRYRTVVETEELMSLEAVTRAATQAKAAGATRFCMGAAYRGPKDGQVEQIAAMIRAVRELGMETCATLGLLTESQAQSPGRSRTRLLQPQPRYLRGVLRQDHHHADLRRPAANAPARTRRGHAGLLRRHSRHG